MTSKIFTLIGTIALIQLARFLVCSNFVCSANSGLVFGMIGNNIMAIVSSFILIGIILCLFHTNIFSFVLIGAVLSNILERIFLGGVRDYISISVWPSFNLADILIVGIVVYVMTNSLFGAIRANQ